MMKTYLKSFLFALLFACPIFLSAAKPVSLFNGKDLTGWKGGNYVVEDGAIVCKGGNLVTEKQYANYVFEFEFLLPAGGNNGLGIHYPGKGGPSGAGMELQILDNKHPKYAKLVDSQYHGSLYKLKAAKRGHLKPAGEWNRQKVTVNGPKVQVVLNGVEILNANLDEINKEKPKHNGAKRRSGHICFCGHGSPVKFRNITILELPESVSLFNGKDLTGWKKGNYVVEDGALVCKGGNLVTEKEYSNYVFEFDFLLPPGGNNGLGVHYPGSGDAAYTGMELQILDNSHERYAKLKDYQYHGSLYTLKAAKRGHLKPVGEWNRQKVTVNGPSVKVVLNGVEILDANLDEINKEKPKHNGAKRRSGHLCFCGHGAPVKFKNITILELPESK